LIDKGNNVFKRGLALIAVIIDSNIFYNDPLWKTSGLRTLIEYSSSKVVKILISDVVIQEVKRNTEKTFEKHLNLLRRSLNTLDKLIVEPNRDILNYLPVKSDEPINSKFKYLNDKGIIDIIKPEDNLLGELIDRAVNKTKPFSEKKEEFRDGVIWLSCVNYAKVNGYEKLYLISNNSNDFADKTDSLNLHHDLKKDFENAYLVRDVKGFLQKEEEELNLLMEKVPVDRMFEWINKQKYTESKIQKTLNRMFLETASYSLINSMEHLDSSVFYSGGQARHMQYSHSELVDVVGPSIVFHANAKFGTVTGKAKTIVSAESYQYTTNNIKNNDMYFMIEFDFSFIISPEQPEPSSLSIDSLTLLETLE